MGLEKRGAYVNIDDVIIHAAVRASARDAALPVVAQPKCSAASTKVTKR